MNIKIKTKSEQIVNPSNGLSANIYLEIENKIHHLSDDRFEFSFKYYYLTNHPETGEPIENILPYKLRGRTLSRDEINMLAATITPTSNNYVDKEREYITAGAFAIVVGDSQSNWGLGASDWEVV